MYTSSVHFGGDVKLTLLELRKKPGKILDAVSHNEEVIISNRGKDVARVVSLNSKEEGPVICAENHEAYGIWKDKQDDVEQQVRNLRKRRYDDI